MILPIFSAVITTQSVDFTPNFDDFVITPIDDTPEIQISTTVQACFVLESRILTVNLIAPPEASGPEILLEAILPTASENLIFEITNTILTTLPSPPFTFGEIEIPTAPSLQIFEQSFFLTEEQADQLIQAEALTLTISDDSGFEEVRDVSLVVIPEPRSLFLCVIALLFFFEARTRTNKIFA